MLVAPWISEWFGLPWSAIVCLGLQYRTFGTFGSFSTFGTFNTFGTFGLDDLDDLLSLLALLALVTLMALTPVFKCTVAPPILRSQTNWFSLQCARRNINNKWERNS